MKLQIVHPYGDLHLYRVTSLPIGCMLYLVTPKGSIHVGYLQIRESEWQLFKREMELQGHEFTPGFN